MTGIAGASAADIGNAQKVNNTNIVQEKVNAQDNSINGINESTNTQESVNAKIAYSEIAKPNWNSAKQTMTNTIKKSSSKRIHKTHHKSSVNHVIMS